MSTYSRPTSSLRSSVGLVGCPPSGWRDKKAGEFMSVAGRELSTLKVFLCHPLQWRAPMAVLSFKLEKGRGRINARVMGAGQTYSSLFIFLVSAILLNTPNWG